MRLKFQARFYGKLFCLLRQKSLYKECQKEESTKHQPDQTIYLQLKASQYLLKNENYFIMLAWGHFCSSRQYIKDIYNVFIFELKGDRWVGQFQALCILCTLI